MIDIFYENKTIIDSILRLLGECNNAKSIQDKEWSLNYMADILVNTRDISCVDSYSELVSELEQIISYCNSVDYERKVFDDKYGDILKALEKFCNNASIFYKINVVFSTDLLKEKYVGLINNEYIENGGAYSVLIHDGTCQQNHFDNYVMSINIDDLLNELVLDTLSLKQPDIERISKLDFLKNDKEFDILSLGSSYSFYGIDRKVISDRVKDVSISGQDMYYSYKVMEHILKSNNHIKTCMISIGYYDFYYDMSSGTSKFALSEIKKIYYPYFKDKHNYDGCVDDEQININLHLIYKNNLYRLFDEKKLSNVVYCKLLDELKDVDYWNDILSREDYRRGLQSKMIYWECDNSGKMKLALQAATGHNKQLQYVDTEKENIEVFKKMLEIASSKNVKLIFVVYPMNELYRELADAKLKEVFYKNIELFREEYDFSVLDLYSNSEFNDFDFVDAYHLSTNGAAKVSKIVNQYLLDEGIIDNEKR